MGMVIIVISIISIFGDAGISNAIIHYRDASVKQLSTLYWLNIMCGIAVFIAVLLLCPVAVIVFREPRLSVYLPYTSLGLLIMAFGQQFSTLLQKDLHFKTLAWIDIISVTISCLAAVSMAFSGMGIWSLVMQPVVQAGVSVCGLFAVALRRNWLPKLHFNLECVRGYLEFGLFQMGERLLNSLYSNIDCFVIGRFLGAEALGYYTLAFNLVRLPLTKINPIVTRVAFPTFAKIQFDDKALRRGFLTIIRYISTFSFPVVAGLFMVAPVFIPVVYGPKWLPAVPVVQVLCMVGALKSLGNPMGSLLLAKGRADIGFYFQIVTVVTISAATVIGVRWGIVGVAWSVLVAVALIFWPITFYIRWYVIRMRVWEYLYSFRIPAVASGVMMVLLWFMSFVWNQMHSIPSLIFQITAGTTIYFFLNWIMARRFCLELKDTIFGRG
jgi:lipopolysaccharide exporter